MEKQMKTQKISISKSAPDINILSAAAKLIKEGQLVAFPTETVYGLGADAFNANAVQTIFSVKERPATDPLIVHIDRVNAINTVAIKIPDLALELANRFWPGPLTLILEKHPNIPHTVTSGGASVAVRMPDHQIALMLIEISGCPIAAPSANRFSRPSPTRADHVWNDLNGKISMILDSGPADIGLESTVLDLTKSPPCILRPGGISMDQLEKIIPDVHIRRSYLTESNQKQISPGQLFKHYSPDARLVAFKGPSHKNVILAMYSHMEKLLENNQSVGIMLVEENIVFFQKLLQKGGLIENLGSRNHLDLVARNLFACMRNLDSAKVNTILIAMPPDNGLGLAINDRLVRASTDVIWIDS
jgi:L-threonylcarbamoyladenylate synthase